MEQASIMAKKAAAPQKSETMAESNQSSNSSETRSGELENLREILFGNQARATEDRLNQLEENLQTLHRTFTDSLNKQSSTLREATATAEKELKTQLNNQANLAQTNHQALEESINQLRADTQHQMDNLQATFSQELENLRSNLSEQIRRGQNESRQRDDDLRQELLTVSSWLDNKLTPRKDLGQLLMELGQHLQNDAQNDDGSPQNE